MPNPRPRIAVVFGGRSGEHEVSIASAQSLLSAIDRSKYDVVPVGITQTGAWLSVEPEILLGGASDGVTRFVPSADPGEVSLPPSTVSGTAIAPLRDGIDAVFSVVHGTYGEDGCLQGLFALAGIPVVGSGVLASANGMDKIMMKKILRADGLPVVDYLPVARADWEADGAAVVGGIEQEIGYPCFVKPSDLGSSVGVSKVRSRDQLHGALALAAEYSGRIIVERGIDAREVECGILGNHDPQPSVVGEIITQHDFYDYDAKYVDPETQFIIPAQVDEPTVSLIQELAIRVFRSIGAEGLARVDFFIERESGEIYVNEINTIPGFTAMSVYPRLWAASGVPYPELIDRLIQLALERHADRARNRTTYV